MTINIGIGFIRTDLTKFVSAVRMVKAEVNNQTMEMSRKCAIDYYQLVQKNIMFQKYSYPPLEERYAEWKAEQGSSPDMFWYLFGDLMQALTAFVVPKEGAYGSSWMGGIPAGVYDSGGKSMFGGKGAPRLIATYAAVNEKRRPLFKPTGLDFARKGWKKRGRESLRIIKRKWK